MQTIQNIAAVKPTIEIEPVLSDTEDIVKVGILHKKKTVPKGKYSNSPEISKNPKVPPKKRRTQI